MGSERGYAIIEAPSNLGLTATGVERLPGQLLACGLTEAVGARHAARLESPPRSLRREEETGILHGSEIALWSPNLADAVAEVMAAGEFPLVLGGDCSIVLGSALALKRRGRYGLLFIDGHTDYYQPDQEPNGEVASMDFAFVTGQGPPLLADLEGRGPLIRAADAVAFGARDADEQAAYGSPQPPTELRVFDLALVRELGAEAAANAAVKHLARAGIDGFLIHLDADVLDDGVMPAVDYRLPGGLTPEELAVTLRVALDSGRATGLEVTIYNPDLDDDGSAGRLLADILIAALGTSAPTA